MNVLIKHLQEDPVPPRRHNPGLPEAVEKVILRLLAKRPDDRYPSAIEAAEAFQASLESAPLRRPRQLVPAPEMFCASDSKTSTEVTPAPPSEDSIIPLVRRPRRIVARRPSALAGGILPTRRPDAGPAEAGPLIEVTLLFTKVQALQEMLDHQSALEALETVGMYERTVEALAAIHRGRLLEGTGSTQILLFEGTVVQNPVNSAMRMVRRLKQEVEALAARHGRRRADLFLSAGIYTAQVRPSRDGSVLEAVRRDVVSGARRLHDLSAAERKYCMLCDASWERVKAQPEWGMAPFKRVYISGRPQPVQVYEMLEAEAAAEGAAS